MLKLDLQHIGLFVEDMQRTIEFYTYILEFQIIHENSLSDENGNLIKVAFLQSGNCVIEAVEFPLFTPRKDGYFDHIAFKVENIEQSIEKLRSKGICFETDTFTNAKHFFSKGNKWILFRGPDNEHLELNEILK